MAILVFTLIILAAIVIEIVFTKTNESISNIFLDIAEYPNTSFTFT